MSAEITQEEIDYLRGQVQIYTYFDSDQSTRVLCALESSRADLDKALCRLTDVKAQLAGAEAEARMFGQESTRLRAEVQRLQQERDAAIDERNAWRSGDQDSRIEADRLRGEVQRLTEEVAQVKGTEERYRRVVALSDGARLDALWQELVAERDALKAEARRSDAGRVEVPVMSADDLEIVYDFTVHYVDKQKTADNVNTWFRSRLSPSPQPATGAALTCDDCDSREGCPKRGAPCMYHASSVAPQPSADVVVPREEWKVLNLIAAFWCPPFGVPQNTATQALFDKLDALRSSTNHDAQDAGEGR